MTRADHEPALYSTSSLIRDESSGSGSCRRARALGFPCLAHFLAPRQDIFLGVLEALVNSRPLNHVAGTAAGNQVGRILLALASARNDEINGHHQRVIKAGSAIESAVPATELIAFQNLQPLGQTYRHVHF